MIVPVAPPLEPELEPELPLELLQAAELEPLELELLELEPLELEPLELELLELELLELELLDRSSSCWKTMSHWIPIRCWMTSHLRRRPITALAPRRSVSGDD